MPGIQTHTLLLLFSRCSGLALATLHSAAHATALRPMPMYVKLGTAWQDPEQMAPVNPSNLCFQADLVAGLSVGIMTVPQSLPYARIAGLPSEYGLYGAFAPVFAYALFGSSRQLVRVVPVSCRQQGAQLSRSSSWRDGSAGCLQRVGTKKYLPLLAPVSCGRCGPSSDHPLLLSNSLGKAPFRNQPCNLVSQSVTISHQAVGLVAVFSLLVSNGLADLIRVSHGYTYCSESRH